MDSDDVKTAHAAEHSSFRDRLEKLEANLISLAEHAGLEIVEGLIAKSAEHDH